MKIRIGFCDFPRDFKEQDNYWLKTLQGMYGKENVEVSKQPDYLFYSCFGFEHLKYSCVKIFYTGENIVPDFNLCDYALGFHEIDFNDRYLRMPLYHLYDNAYQKAIDRNRFDDTDYLERKFCCSVISNSLGDSARNRMLSLLEQYKSVDNGGRYKNNIGGCVKDKLEFESHYKFTLCFENSSTIGYTTEKLLEGFAGGGIPIYWGNPHVGKEFNPKAFIDCGSFETLQDAVEYIKEIDRDDRKYLEIVRENIFENSAEAGKYENIQQQVIDFLKNIFEQEYEKAFRRNRENRGKSYIERMRYFRNFFEIYRFRQRIKNYIKNNVSCKYDGKSLGNIHQRKADG